MIKQNIIFSKLQQKHENKMPREYYAPTDNRWENVWNELDRLDKSLFCNKRIHQLIDELLYEPIEEFDEEHMYTRNLTESEIINKVIEYVND